VHSVAITEEISICPSELPYEYNGEQYTEAGTYEIALETENHCDSIVTLVLNVYEQPEVSVSQVTNGAEITLTAEGASTYEWETGETTASITIEAANDTLWVIGYNEYQCADTAEVVISDLSSVDGIEATINVYPVPSNGVVFVEGDGINSLEVLDLSGKILRKSLPSSTVTEINMDVPSGEYILRIETENGIMMRKILIAR
jgi:hypothetical protein